MIIFTTPTQLDLNMLRFMGVSVKETSSPIGFFGTGLKYAIAVLLRTGHQIEIYIDGIRHSFAIREKIFRGEPHKTIVMLDHSIGAVQAEVELPFTLNYGRTWEVWMAYRELVSNTYDEKGEVGQGPIPADLTGKTVITVIGEEIEQVSQDHFKYFLSPDKIGDLSPTISIHRNKTSQGIFYRGVRVATLNSARFAYSISGTQSLTEDRTLSSIYSVLAEIGQSVVRKCQEPETIRAMVQVSSRQEQSFEADLDFDWSEPSETFISVVGELIKLDQTKVNASACLTWERATATSSINTAPFSPMQQKALDKALELLARCGYEGVGKYPILRMVNNPYNQLGQARDGQIFLTDQCFKLGVKSLMGTLLEEYFHLSREVHDCTREFQDLLLTLVVDLLEEHVLKEVI